jgi:hypothetical protein
MNKSVVHQIDVKFHLLTDVLVHLMFMEHVEQLRSIGIINPTTRLHLVGSFYQIYGYACSLA